MIKVWPSKGAKPCGEWARDALNPETGATVIWASGPSHITLGLGLQGMPISLGFWEWGFPNRGDDHITVTSEERYLPYRKSSTKGENVK